MNVRLEPGRQFGRTGQQVPLIGYGTAPLGKEVTRARAVRCFNHATHGGITYLDTSPDYGSEPHVKGRLLWLHDTKVMGWETEDEPARVRY